MDELAPVILGALLGGVTWRGASGRGRVALALLAVIVSAFAASVLSGELAKSWLYLLLDLSEAALGVLIGVAVARVVAEPSRLRRVLPRGRQSLP